MERGDPECERDRARVEGERERERCWWWLAESLVSSMWKFEELHGTASLRGCVEIALRENTALLVDVSRFRGLLGRRAARLRGERPPWRRLVDVGRAERRWLLCNGGLCRGELMK